VAAARARPRLLPRRPVRDPRRADRGADARAEAQLFEAIRTLLGGRSVLLISHRFSSVRTADRIHVLHDGRIAEAGTHCDLMDAGGRYAELFTLQAAAYR
jgi:ATP-binding cassette subfamily B protein